MVKKSKPVFVLATIFFCLIISSQSVSAFTYPKSARQRRLGSKPSWLTPVPIISRTIWELKYSRYYSLGKTSIRYTYGQILTLIAVPTAVLAPTILSIKAAKKKKKNLKIKEKTP